MREIIETTLKNNNVKKFFKWFIQHVRRHAGPNWDEVSGLSALPFQQELLYVALRQVAQQEQSGTRLKSTRSSKKDL